MKRLAATLVLAALAAGPGFAQRPSATIQDAAWLVGRWVGEGFGGELEETWSAPAGGQMIGHFRMVREGRPIFYELVLIEEHSGGLRYRVKHFNPDFVGWEEKHGFHEFAWVGATQRELRFDGLILRNLGGGVSDHLIVTRSTDGSVKQQTLRYRRADDGTHRASR